MDHVTDSSSEGPEATILNHPRSRKTPWRALAAAAGVLAATAAIGTLSWSARGLHHGRTDATTVLVEEKKEALSEQESVCEHLPFFRLESLVSSNLGGSGPDKEAEEGIIYKAKSFHMGLDATEDLEVHLHAVNEYHNHHRAEGTLMSEKVDPEYKAAWPKKNGIDGHFASVNIEPGSNVTLQVHAYDKTQGKEIKMKQFAMTFFDLDTGKDNKLSIEYVKAGGFEHYFHTNETEINITKMPDGQYLFKATKEGTGEDNPKNPLQLTELQKDRSVSFIFKDAEMIQFEVGATEGKTARVFDFVLRPALRCAWTILEDGNLEPSDVKESPVTIVEGSANGIGHALSILAVAFSLLVFN